VININNINNMKPQISQRRQTFTASNDKKQIVYTDYEQSMINNWTGILGVAVGIIGFFGHPVHGTNDEVARKFLAINVPLGFAATVLGIMFGKSFGKKRVEEYRLAKQDIIDFQNNVKQQNQT